MESTVQTIKNSGQLNSHLKLFIKLAVSAGLLIWIISKIRLDSLGAAISGSNLFLLFAAFLMVNLCMLVSVLKWRPFLTLHKVHFPFARLLSFYYVCLFANNFLPSSIGGDAMRIYDVAKASGKPQEAAASVIAERLLASLALALTAAAAWALVSGIGGGSLTSWLVGGILVFCLAATVVLFCFNFREDGKVGRWLCRLGSYKKHPGLLLKVLLLSFLFQFIMVLANVLIFQALGVNIPLLKHFLFIPVIMAVSMVPLSINGLGIREGMFVMLYGAAGVDAATSLAGALLFFTMITVTRLAGGVSFALRK